MMMILICVIVILGANDPLGFYIVFRGAEAGVLKLSFCIMLVLVLVSSHFLSPHISLFKLIKKADQQSKNIN